MACFPHFGALHSQAALCVVARVLQQEECKKKTKKLLLTQLSTIKLCEALLTEVREKPWEM